LTSGHRISTTFNGQKHFKKIAGSKVLDEDYNSYLRKYGWMPHNAGFGFLDLTPSILLLRQFWD
jgi:hypothetical protein